MSTATIEPPLVLTEQQMAGLEMLRKEVPENLIGKLPKVTCRDCSKSSCQKHSKNKCRVCAAWISSEHIHLDFVGHAETTSQFLAADLTWNWEPMGFDANGLPFFDDIGGLWIRLTICGVTRIGYGTADNASNFKAKGDVRKEIIGDALRNAGMRFGHALNLWAKTDIHERQQEAEPATVREPKPARAAGKVQRSNGPAEQDPWAAATPETESVKGQHIAISKLFAEKFGITSQQRDRKLAGVRHFLGVDVPSTTGLSYAQAARLIEILAPLPPHAPATVPLSVRQSESPEAIAEAQALLPLLEADEADRVESSLRDLLESAGSPEELRAAWPTVEARQSEGRIGAVHVSALRQVYELRVRSLAAEYERAVAARQPQEAGAR